MKLASYLPGELIPCAFVWLDPGITPCCKTRPLFAARLDLSVDQFVGFLPRACNSVDTYAAQGTVGDGGGRQRNLTRRRKF
jgi:hypothetical protein